ncbi:hypothetical protein AGMMS49944_03790 [Spirochaetia bacterium]|nr:hypothetical protein AGMMS49944_03790 [Spirochaetia bacterium]
MKRPAQFDPGYEITFNSQHGKNVMILAFMEFLGSYYYPPCTENCYSKILRGLYKAMKAGKVTGADDDSVKRANEE